MFSTEMAEHFNFTLSTFSSHLPLLKDADLITGKKQVLFIESKGNLGLVEQ
jgi:DNA-binding transcriptional ArsR family regulator